MKNCIYRFLNNNNEIIYIGKAIDLKLRLSNHKHLSEECYKERAKIEYFSLDTKDEMDLAERYLIAKIKPKYNVVFKDRDINFEIKEFDNKEWIDINIDKKPKEKISIYRKNIEKFNEIIKNKEKELEEYLNILNEINQQIDDLVVLVGKVRPSRVSETNKQPYYINHDWDEKSLKIYSELDEKLIYYIKEVNKLRDVISKYKVKKVYQMLKEVGRSNVETNIIKLYIKHDSIDDEFIINKELNEKKEYYINKLKKSIKEKGYYDYNEFITLLDDEFVYKTYDNNRTWLKFIDKDCNYNKLKYYADKLINEIEKEIEKVYGHLVIDTVIEKGYSILNNKREVLKALVVKRIKR